MTIEIDLSVEAGGWGDAEAVSALIRQSVDAAVGRLGAAAADSELSVLLTDDAAMQRLNAQWRDKDRPTNVLSFPAAALSPGDAPGPVLGDIVVAFQTVVAEAALEDKSFEDHLRHMIVHGLLHLFGYDHLTDEDADEMETLETAILADIGVSDPYSA
ncbi:rRNA maturation RNase YbeY [Oricola sp.]|uniref:rRNA maturation RNase YbeY n=1 Tax=Oricola sp. TaxID=1979950 RepID=UPI003BA9BD43